MTRERILKLAILVAFGAILLRLFHIQVLDTSYKAASENNVLRREVLYPPRGEVFDRNGEFLVQSREAYDLVVIPREVKQFDTVYVSAIVGVPVETLRRNLQRAVQFSSRRPSVVVKQMTKAVKVRLDELNLPGFYMQYRTVRDYPRKIAGNLLGYVGEVDQNHIDRDPYYRMGDYVGMSGIELSYESVLRGEKGAQMNMVDVLGIRKGSYMDGIYDTLPVQGSYIVSTIDAKLQALGEELLQGKVGSIVAIDPSTGEVLAMVSSPTYDPDELLGNERGNNYAKLLEDPRKPLFNRAVMASYPPGSTLKLINGLIGLQEEVLVPSQLYSCIGGFPIGRGVKCHDHKSPLNLIEAVETSCNSYFCYVFRSILNKGGSSRDSTRSNMDKWAEYLRSFGFGTKLGTDFIGELDGNVPSSELYDRKYSGRWNYLTVISLAIGQGELGATPLQMANLAAIVANRGYYYPPHVVREIESRDSLDRRFYEKHYTMVDREHFDPIVEGMYRAVNVGGTGTIAAVRGLDICGKTGTAQNPQGADHSTFLSFAPRENPKIAISVYVENGRFGATVSAPIASLMTQHYLTGEVNTALYDYVRNLAISYPVYASAGQ